MTFGKKNKSVVKGTTVDLKALVRAMKSKTLTLEDAKALTKLNRYFEEVFSMRPPDALSDDMPKQPGGHEADKELIEMLFKAARKRTNDPRNGFVSSLHTSDETGELDGLAVYAWGESAAVLAENLKFHPAGREAHDKRLDAVSEARRRRYLVPPAETSEEREDQIRDEIEFPGLLYGGPRERKS